MSRELFREQQRRGLILEELTEYYAKIARHLNDGRPALGVDLCHAVIEAAESLGDHFTTTQYPVCLACGGTAEMPSYAESDRKMRCQDQPRVCKGNGFGRMHPIQMLAFIEDAAIPKGAAPDLAAPTVPDENLGDIRPTPIAGRDAPSPPYVYDREAVIAYNAAKTEPTIPVPEADEEVLAHADGTFTVRKTVKE